MTIFFKILGGIAPLAPFGYAYGSDSVSPILCNKGTIKCCCLCRTSFYSFCITFDDAMLHDLLTVLTTIS